MQERFLAYVYEKNFGAAAPSLSEIDLWIKQQNFNAVSFWRIYEEFCHTEVIKYDRNADAVHLTPRGVLHAEKNGWIDPAVIAANRAIRKRLLVALAEHLDEVGTTIALAQLLQRSRLCESDLHGNMGLLIGLGFAKWPPPGTQISISPTVYEKVQLRSKVA